MARLQQLVQDLQLHLADNRRGERLRSGLQLAILGQPNVGKSSLLNALTQRPAAIVSSIPGGYSLGLRSVKQLKWEGCTGLVSWKGRMRVTELNLLKHFEVEDQGRCGMKT